MVEEEEQNPTPKWVEENINCHKRHINLSPRDFAPFDMPPPSPKFKKHLKNSESYFEIIQQIMRGFGDFDYESNV